MTYNSRLLRALNVELERCASRADRSRLICRKAIHLARLNRLHEARAEIDRLRGELGTSLDVSSGSWIFLAEGVVSYFELNLEQSFDRLRRACGIAKSANVKSAYSLASAWLAHVAFHRGEYTATIDHLLESISHSDSNDHAARCRAAMVASIYMGYSNLPAPSRLWMHRARHHANSEGDESSIAALLFNSTVYRINEARIAHAFGKPLPDDFDAVQLELNSSLNFDSIADGAGLPDSPSVIRAHVLAIRGDFGNAIPIFQKALENGVFAFNRAAVEADYSYSLAEVGRLEDAMKSFECAKAALNQAHDPDDQAFALSRLSKVQHALGHREAGDEFATSAGIALQEFRNTQDLTRKQCERLPDPSSI